MQDKFFEYMQEAGFKGFERGERGSDAENLSCTQYKLERDKKHLAEIEEKIASADEKLSTILPVRASAEIIDNMGKKTLTGKIQMSAEDYGYISNLAKECLVNRRTVQIYESSNRALSEKIKELQSELTEIKEKCRPYLEALKLAPQKVKEFIGGILDKFRQQKAQQEKEIFYKPAEKENYEPIRKLKHKKKEDYER